MQVTLKLFASLSQYLPVGHQNYQITLDVPEGTTVNGLLEVYHLPPKLVHLVLVNGSYIEPADRPHRALIQNDVLAVWPPVAGG
jgi:sulfur carrier protein ThiS